MSQNAKTLFEAVQSQVTRSLSSRSVRWALAFATILVMVAVITSLDRFTEWDEAAFYARSGGYKGTEPPRMWFSPSREGGPSALIAAVRMLGVGLVGVRLVWVLLALVLAAVTYHRLGRRYAPFAAEIAFMGFGLSWLSLAYLGSLYGSLFAGLLLLLSAALILDLVDATPRSVGAYTLGLFLGLSVAAAFWMRQIEAVIGLLVLVVFSVAIQRAVIWRRNARAVLVAGGTFVLAFIVPWIIWTVSEFGSVAGRFEALQRQRSWADPARLTNGLEAYLDAMSGKMVPFGLYALVPDWPRRVVLTSLAFVVVAVAVAIWRGNLRSTSLWGIGLLAAIPAVLFAFFAFYYAAVEVQERYLTTMVPFVAGLGGIGLAGWLHIPAVRWRRHLRAGFFVVIAVIWLFGQLAIAAPIQRARVADADGTLLTADAIRVAAEGRPCIGASLYGRVQLQLGTGCEVRDVFTDSDAVATAREFEGRRGTAAFILWPVDLQIGPRWQTIDRTSEAGPGILHLLREGDF